MTKITPLSDLTSLTNEQSALATLATNNDRIEEALQNTLSLDGSTPNSMAADLDMDSQRIMNLPLPLTDTEPLRLGDVGNLIEGVSPAVVSTFMRTVLDDETALAARATLGTGGLTTANTWSAQQTLTSGLEMSGNPGISKSFSGQTNLFGFYNILTAASGTQAEVGGHFGITSSTGASPDPLIAYKMALATSTTVSSGSGYGWGINSVVNIGAGGTKRGGIGHEINLNNNWGDYTGSPGSPYAAGILVTGTNTGGYSSFGIGVEYGGAGNMWKSAYHAGPAGSGGIETATFWDETDSPRVLYATGTYAVAGIDFTSATFGTAASIAVPGTVIGQGVGSQTFTGSGTTVPMNFNSMSTVSANAPEVGGQFTLTSTGGSADRGANYKVALTSSVVGNADSGNIYGNNIIVQGHGGTYKVTGIEVDVNNVGAHANSLAASTAVYGYEAVAAGSFESTAAFWATGISPAMWTYGFATRPASGDGVKTADFFSDSNATHVLQVGAVGTHTTYINTPNWQVSAGGAQTGVLSMQWTGSTATAGPSIFQNSNVLTVAMGTGGFQIDNNAVNAQRFGLSDTGKLTLSAVTTFASATAANWDDWNITSQTTTITGNTGTPITRLAKASIYRPTLTDSSAVTVTDAASMYIENSPLAAGSVTITNGWALLAGARISATGFVASSNTTGFKLANTGGMIGTGTYVQYLDPSGGNSMSQGGTGDPTNYFTNTTHTFNNRDNSVTYLTMNNTSSSFVRKMKILNGTAIPAGGTTDAGYSFSSTANFGIFFGSGVPTLSAAQGSLYLRSDGSSTSTRLYVNTNGGTTWTNVTTAA